ncbi:MAG: hypothetical protein KC561_08685 [Myxococcales bacterium]|nr:hypothetical protein [Myxococcales bacterium]
MHWLLGLLLGGIAGSAVAGPVFYVTFEKSDANTSLLIVGLCVFVPGLAGVLVGQRLRRAKPPTRRSVGRGFLGALVGLFAFMLAGVGFALALSAGKGLVQHHRMTWGGFWDTLAWGFGIGSAAGVPMGFLLGFLGGPKSQQAPDASTS